MAAFSFFIQVVLESLYWILAADVWILWDDPVGLSDVCGLLPEKTVRPKQGFRG
jgi:hypothetical protein